MASNYTTNYELPLWEPQDSFLRTEFNDANQKIDTALTAANAERIHVGSYTGDGTTGTRTIPLPFTPKVVMVSGQKPLSNITYSIFTVAFGEYCHQFYGDGNSTSGNVSIVENGFQVQGSYHNDSGTVQRYIAFR